MMGWFLCRNKISKKGRGSYKKQNNKIRDITNPFEQRLKERKEHNIIMTLFTD